jgi:hypothetical protein
MIAINDFAPPFVPPGTICYKWTRISQNFWKLVSNMLKMERNIAIFGLSNMLFSHRHKGSFPGPMLSIILDPDHFHWRRAGSNR